MTGDNQAAVRLACAAQTYDWGKLGADSMVARLGPSSSGAGFVCGSNTPYAELWMGTHPNAPSMLWSDRSVSLQQHIQSAPQHLLTDAVCRVSDGDLPFLFKVLSVRKALSIQAHPSKDLARTLHATAPHLYKDANHKPEMTLALTPFEGLCGFRPVEEIALHFNAYPLFKQAVGADVADEFVRYVREWGAQSRVVPPSPLVETEINKALQDTDDDREALRKVFTALMEADSVKIAALVTEMAAQLKAVSPLPKGSVEELIVRLHSQFPGDVGCLCVLLMNYVHLQPGQAMFLAANEPHAYLSGDCVECMAASDNVVRAGLTPKVKDVATLVSMLTYSTYTPADIVSDGSEFAGSTATRIYKAPVQEFDILRTELAGNGASDKCRPIRGPSIALCTQGRGQIAVHPEGNATPAQQLQLEAGTVYFIGANCSTEIVATDGATPLTVYRAFCELEQ